MENNTLGPLEKGTADYPKRSQGMETCPLEGWKGENKGHLRGKGIKIKNKAHDQSFISGEVSIISGSGKYNLGLRGVNRGTKNKTWVTGKR